MQQTEIKNDPLTELPVHAAQLLSYLKQIGGGRGLLINFNEKLLKHGLRRLIV